MRALLLALFCCVPAAPAQQTPAAMADAYLQAWRSGDESAIASALPGKHDLCFYLADELFGRHVDRVLAAGESDFLAAAAECARRVKEIPGNTALPELVARWQALSADDLRVEQELRRGTEEAGAARDQKDADRAAELVEGLRQELRAAPWSIAGQTVLSRCGQVLIDAGRFEAGLALMRRAAKVSRDFGWLGRTAATLVTIQKPLFRHAQLDEGLAVAEELVQLFATTGEEASRLTALRFRAIGLKMAQRLSEAAEQYLACGDGFAANGDEVAALMCRISGGEMLRAVERYDEAIAVLEGARAAARDLDPYWQITVLSELVGIHGPRRELDRWREVAAELQRVAEAHDDLDLRARVYLVLAEGRLTFHQAEEAERLLDAAEALQPKSPGALGQRLGRSAAHRRDSLRRRGRRVGHCRHVPGAGPVREGSGEAGGGPGQAAGDGAREHGVRG